MVIHHAIHQHLQERNWVGLEVDLCLTGCQNSLREYHNGHLPIHYAINRNCPDKLILDMIKIYPGCATRKNTQGDLPLHSCAKFGASTTVMTALLLEYPDAINVKALCKLDGRFLTPRDLARCNPMVTDEGREILDRPLSHWTSLAAHERFLREKAFDTRMIKIQAQLKKSKENEKKLIERLVGMEKRLAALEIKSKAGMKSLEKKVIHRIEDEHDHIVDMRQDLTSLIHHNDVKRKKSKYTSSAIGTSSNRRASSASVTNHRNRRTSMYGSEDEEDDELNDLSYIELMYSAEGEEFPTKTRYGRRMSDTDMDYTNGPRRRRSSGMFGSIASKFSKGKRKKALKDGTKMTAKAAINFAANTILPLDEFEG